MYIRKESRVYVCKDLPHANCTKGWEAEGELNLRLNIGGKDPKIVKVHNSETWKLPVYVNILCNFDVNSRNSLKSVLSVENRLVPCEFAYHHLTKQAKYYSGSLDLQLRHIYIIPEVYEVKQNYGTSHVLIIHHGNQSLSCPNCGMWVISGINVNQYWCRVSYY